MSQVFAKAVADLGAKFGPTAIKQLPARALAEPTMSCVKTATGICNPACSLSGGEAYGCGANRALQELLKQEGLMDPALASQANDGFNSSILALLGLGGVGVAAFESQRNDEKSSLEQRLRQSAKLSEVVEKVDPKTKNEPAPLELKDALNALKISQDSLPSTTKTTKRIEDI